jgi:hypothetical protein
VALCVRDREGLDVSSKAGRVVGRDTHESDRLPACGRSGASPSLATLGLNGGALLGTTAELVLLSSLANCIKS